MINGFKKAIERLALAKKRNAKIALWGDYDADGITGTLVLYEGLKDLGFENFLISLSGRAGIYNQGEKEIERMAKEKVGLIISVDFGVSANKQIKLAKEKGIDFIVLDHHLPPKILPSALIINYSKDKSAAGVVFELVKKLYRKEKRPPEEIEKFLDLVAIATIADKIPLIKSNKKIVSGGIKRINRGCRPGLSALAKKIKIKKLTLNNFERFVDRVDFPKGVNEKNNLFRLMSSEDKKEIVCLVEEVENHYRKAQKIIKENLKENIAELASQSPLPKVIFIENKINWPQPGINGLVANQLVRKFNRPAFVYTRSGDKIKASARAPRGFNLVKALRFCSAELFYNFGGHHRAAGFKASIENLEKIKECLKNYYQLKK